MRKLFLTLASTAVFAVACSDEPQAPTDTSGTIQLSAAQAAAIRTRVAQIAPVHPELAFLADTISLIVGEGIEVEPVNVTTDASSGPFYAVALQRTIVAPNANSAAFDVILFNNPSNPTDFIVVSGWTNPNDGQAPPAALSGSFGAPTDISVISGHIFHVSGSTVSAWRAASGTATFTRGGTSGSCPQVPNIANITCQAADLNATFTITTAMSDDMTVSSTRSASLPAADVAGIIINMSFF